MDKNDPKVIDTINKLARKHSSKRFGYLTKDDIFNEVWVICLEKLDEFDGTKGNLESFLSVIVRNRLINRNKDITKLIKSPCPTCPFYKVGVPGDCKKFKEAKHQCSKWAKYELNKSSRDSLLNASEDKVERQAKDSVIEQLSGKEIRAFVLEKLDPKFDRDFKQFMTNGELPSFKMNRLRKHIRQIIEDYEVRKEKIFINIKVNGKEI